MGDVCILSPSYKDLDKHDYYHSIYLSRKNKENYKKKHNESAKKYYLNNREKCLEQKKEYYLKKKQLKASSLSV